MAKDYVIQFKVKNGPMLSVMRANGMKTAAALHRASGVDQSAIGRYLNLLQSPWTENNRWSTSILKIAKTLKVVPEMLFPEQHILKPLEKNRAEIEMDLEDMEQLTGEMSTDHLLGPTEDDQDTVDLLREKIHTIASREEECLVLRFGLDGNEPKSLKAVGDWFGVSPERVRQIEAKALRKLRHKSRMGSHPRLAPMLLEQDQRQHKEERERFDWIRDWKIQQKRIHSNEILEVFKERG